MDNEDKFEIAGVPGYKRFGIAGQAAADFCIELQKINQDPDSNCQQIHSERMERRGINVKLAYKVLKGYEKQIEKFISNKVLPDNILSGVLPPLEAFLEKSEFINNSVKIVFKDGTVASFGHEYGLGNLNILDKLAYDLSYKPGQPTERGRN